MIATPLPDAGRFAATTRPRVVIDTDAFNEIDDQFALAWALRSAERMSVEAVYAAPFHNERSIGPGDGMRKSLAEIGNVLDALGGEPPAVRAGAEEFLTGGSPRRSPAVDDLIARAASSAPDDPLHVIAIGAPTNIASALLDRAVGSPAACGSCGSAVIPSTGRDTTSSTCGRIRPPLPPSWRRPVRRC